MSLGNVTYSDRNGHLFDQAVLYLRKAQKVPGYNLPRHLQEYVFFYSHFSLIREATAAKALEHIYGS